MEVLQLVPQFGSALWSLKLMYDQDVANRAEIEELQSFIQDYNHQTPILSQRLREGGGNVMGMAAFKILERDVMEAIKKLERWSKDKSFFRVFNSAERMQKLGKLHTKVMACVQKSLGIASVSMLLELQATQATILESNAELKSLLISSIGNHHGILPAEVREEVLEASSSSFGDPKFWEDILAAVDMHKGGVSSSEEKSAYEDPISSTLMIDPIVASDGNTYCRWTLIDNNLTRSPLNMEEDLTIAVDNLYVRRILFEKFPKQCQIFRQRRDEYRSRALSLQAKGSLGDAAFALRHVLQWDKRDVECIVALDQVQGALKEAKEKYLQAFVGPPNESSNMGAMESSMTAMVVAPSLEVTGVSKLSHELHSCALAQVQGVVGETCENFLQAPSMPLNKASIGGLLESNALEMVEQMQVDPKETPKSSLQASKGPSNEVGSTSPMESSKLDMVVGPLVDLNKPYTLLPHLSSSSEEVQQHALYGISQCSARDVDFQAYIIDNGGVKCLADLLNSANEELALLVLLHLSTYVQTSLRASQDAKDALGMALLPLGRVLADGSTQACEQATRILYNLAKCGPKPNDKFSILNLALKESGIVDNLVMCFDKRSFPIQEIVASTLHHLFNLWWCNDDFMKQALNAQFVPILLKLMKEQPRTMLELGLPLLKDMFLSSFFVWGIQNYVPPSMWLYLAASTKSLLHQERAVSILCKVCCHDSTYREQVFKEEVIERLFKLTQSSTLSRSFPDHVGHLTKSGFKFSKFFSSFSKFLSKPVPVTKQVYSYPSEIPFPEKEDWWSPTV